ncbi:MAG: hypothetical protein M1836_005292 [Candelina mexicana]|nr:MAG: hypothetical protein M1836_005292 [Candelina mexicana]
MARYQATNHRDLAAQHELFTKSAYDPGSQFILPDGAHVFNKLVNFLRAQYSLFGFKEVITPSIYKKPLWEKSGHWENYKDDMFEVRGRGASGQTTDAEIGEDEELVLKPMNCPGHCLLFKSKIRSYRDLPIRYADFSALHRNEISGAVSGLTRVRRFHQDDAHIFCRQGQIADEISRTLAFVKLVPSGNATAPSSSCRKLLESSRQEWTTNEGDDALYDPKIDIILKDPGGKEHQTATIQLDFQLPQRFELQYYAPVWQGILEDDLPSLRTPEKTVYAKLVKEHCSEVKSLKGDTSSIRPSLHGPYFNIEIDNSDRSLGKKVSKAKRAGYKIIMTVGQRNVEDGTINLDISALDDQTSAPEILESSYSMTKKVDPKAVQLDWQDTLRLLSNLERKAYE